MQAPRINYPPELVVEYMGKRYIEKDGTFLCIDYKPITSLDIRSLVRTTNKFKEMSEEMGILL